MNFTRLGLFYTMEFAGPMWFVAKFFYKLFLWNVAMSCPI